jgi:DUF1680 family protein
MTRRDLVVLAQLRGATRADAIQKKATPFLLKHVRLLSGEWLALQERNRAFLHDLEPDRLLHTFRLNASLPSTAEPLNGWERPDIELRGHFMGHYLSACALMQASARDEQLKAKADRIVAELGHCQKALGNGYLSAFPASTFDRLRDGLPVWAPWYTIHKIMAGLLDMYSLAGNEQALEMVEGMAGWTERWAGAINDRQMARIHEVEFGGMGELLNNLHGVTGKQRWADLAHRFEHERVLKPLAEGRDELKGQHVNTTIPKLIAAARHYELTGDARSKKMAEFFWQQVTAQRSYCTGGTSNVERWRTDPGKLATELSDVTQECCCTYNMLKLTRHLFSWTGESSYADYYERALLNGVIGTMNPADGMTMYYVPMASGYWKMFSLPRRSFWCCTGSGVESFSKLADSIYFHDDRGIYVNLFAPSEVEWPEKHMRLRQETQFPDQENTMLVVQVERPTELALRIRVPHWATGGISLKLNGRALERTGEQSGYRVIERTWQNGDSVEVSLPMELRTEALPGDARQQAILYGPLVLAGELGFDGLTREWLYGDPVNARGGKFLRGDAVSAPEFHATSARPSDWIKPVAGRPLAFRTTGQSRDVTLIPFNRLFGQRYAIYWQVTS